VAAQAGRVPPQGLRTIRELPVVLEERTLFLERVLHTHREELVVLVVGPRAALLVQRMQVTAAEAVTATQLRTVEMEVLE
jgi:hypothetical protein